MIKKLFIVVVIALMVFMSVGCDEHIPDPPQPPSTTSIESGEVDITNMKWVCEFHRAYVGFTEKRPATWECHWE